MVPLEFVQTHPESAILVKKVTRFRVKQSVYFYIARGKYTVYIGIMRIH